MKDTMDCSNIPSIAEAVAEADRIAPAHREMIEDLLHCFDWNLSPEEVERLRDARDRDAGQLEDTPRV